MEGQGSFTKEVIFKFGPELTGMETLETFWTPLRKTRSKLWHVHMVEHDTSHHGGVESEPSMWHEKAGGTATRVVPSTQQRLIKRPILENKVKRGP